LEAKLATIDSAREAAVAARQLPDPKLMAGITNLPLDGPEAFSVSSDFMTMRMIGITQDFPRREKRELRGQLLELDGVRSASELEYLRQQITRDTGLAWLAVWRETRVAELIRAKLRETEEQIDTLIISLRNARATTADVALARVELETLADREREAKGREAAARAALGRWIGGEHARSPLPEVLPTVTVPPSMARDLLRAVETHPHLRASATTVEIAEREASLAHLSTKPDWNLQVLYGQRGPAYSSMLTVQIGIDLPLFQTNRQDRLIRSRLAQADEARALREDMLRQMRADLAGLYALWESNRQRADAFRAKVLPEARLRQDAAAVVYRSGKGSLYEVLLARRAFLDLEIEALEREVEAVRDAVRIAFYTEHHGDTQ
ncbi:MAG TPA: TolC family protein, partial [Burkholderiales bacterium]|nr:TolC family protein [Burkholderiales bacterium]